MPKVGTISATTMAMVFHQNYERLAKKMGYRTRPETAVPWEQVPFKNQAVMIETCKRVLAWMANAVSELPLSSGESEDSPGVHVVSVGTSGQDSSKSTPSMDGSGGSGASGFGNVPVQVVDLELMASMVCEHADAGESECMSSLGPFPPCGEDEPVCNSCRVRELAEGYLKKG